MGTIAYSLLWLRTLNSGNHRIFLIMAKDHELWELSYIPYHG